MVVRELNYEKDLDQAVSLFNKSFPEKITKDYLVWKHMENPFGKSTGLVAVEDGKIVGLRLFMNWKFSTGEEVYHAIRPVDTCTDPDYRGRGIFKKLTQKGLEETTEQRDLIFNTPNSNSIGGYLKMGWKKIQTPIQYNIGCANPLSKKMEFSFIETKDVFTNLPLEDYDNKIYTELSENYLKWRYKFPRYKIARFADNTIIVYKVQKMKGIKLLVLEEIRGANDNVEIYLNSIAIKIKTPFIYYLNNHKLEKAKFPFTFRRGSQNVVTNEDKKGILRRIDFSAGDLEGVL